MLIHYHGFLRRDIVIAMKQAYIWMTYPVVDASTAQRCMSPGVGLRRMWMM